MKMRDPVEMEMVFHHETDMAVLVSKTGDEEDAVWLPKSQIRIDGGSPHDAILSKGEYVTITLPQWLVGDKGIYD